MVRSVGRPAPAPAVRVCATITRMARVMSISARTRLPELMDDPALEPRRHAEALRGLARINRWSGSVRILWGPLRMLARRRGGRTLRVLDLATGAGDLPIGLWRRAQRAGLPLELAACDASPRAEF